MTVARSIHVVLLGMSCAAPALGRPGYGSESPLNAQAERAQRDEKVFLALYEIDELKLTGIVKTPKGFQAMFIVPGTRKTFFGKVGDRFLDGEILGITQKSVSVRQNAPPGATKGVKRELLLRDERQHKE